MYQAKSSLPVRFFSAENPQSVSLGKLANNSFIRDSVSLCPYSWQIGYAVHQKTVQCPFHPSIDSTMLLIPPHQYSLGFWNNPLDGPILMSHVRITGCYTDDEPNNGATALPSAQRILGHMTCSSSFFLNSRRGRLAGVGHFVKLGSRCSARLIDSGVMPPWPVARYQMFKYVGIQWSRFGTPFADVSDLWAILWAQLSRNLSYSSLVLWMGQVVNKAMRHAEMETEEREYTQKQGTKVSFFSIKFGFAIDGKTW